MSSFSPEITKVELESMSNEELQQLFGLVLKQYVSRLNDNPGMRPFAEDSIITATEAVITVTRILKHVNLEVFELGMWQTLGSIR